jgi:hypothetical protein
VRKEAMEAEKQNVKALLKDELGLFKKDGSVGNYQEGAKPNKDATITVDWEENNPQQAPEKMKRDDAKPATKTTEAEKPSDKKKKTPKWLEEKD